MKTVHCREMFELQLFFLNFFILYLAFSLKKEVFCKHLQRLFSRTVLNIFLM